MSGTPFIDPIQEDRAERRFRLLAEAIPQFVWTTRPDGSCDYSNRRWYEYSGLCAESSLDAGWRDAVHPDDRQRLEATWAQSLVSHESMEFEYRLRRADGVYRWFLARAEPILDDKGNVVHWFGTSTDIDDRKTLTDDRLRIKAERLKLAAQAARLGYWDWDIPGDRISWSDSLEELSGTSPEQFGFTFANFLGTVHPDDRARVDAAVRTALEQGTPYETEFRLGNPDGTYRWGLARGQVYYDRAGRPVRMSGIEVDITARKKAEEEARHQNARFLASVDTLLDCFAVLSSVRDDEGRIVDFRIDLVNEPACLSNGIPRESQLGRRLLEVLPLHRENGLFDKYCQVVETGQPLELEDSFRDHDETGAPGSRVFAIRASKLDDGLVCAWREVTAAKSSEEALRVSEERFRLAALATNGLVYDWTPGSDTVHRIGRLEEITGYTTEEACSTGDWWRDRVHPDDLPRVVAAERLALEGGADRFSVAYRIRHRDGRWIDIEDNSLVLRDDRGVIRRMIGCSFNVSERKLAEERLRVSESMVRGFAENAPLFLGLVEISADDIHIIFNNPATIHFFGLDPDIPAGKRASELGISRETLDIWLGHYRRSLETAAPVRFEYEQQTPLGRRWVSATVTHIGKQPGGRDRFAYIGEDITDRKTWQDDLRRSEEQLRHSERRVRKILDSLFAFAGVCTPEGVLIEANRTALRAAGIEPEDVLGKPFEETYWWSHSPDTQRRLRESIARAAAGETVRYDAVVRLAQGRLAVIDFMLAPLYDDEGRLEFLIPSAMDVTERKRAEEDVRRLNTELNASLQELRAILDTAPVGINVARDPGCKVITGNHALAEMFGMPYGENISKSRDDAATLPFRVLKHGKDAPAETLPMQRAAATGLPADDELFEIVRADGSRLQIMVRANPIKDETGDVVGAVGICVDVTALKRAEEALKEADRRKDEFLGMLAHELRNPVAAISSAHQLVRTPGTTADDAAWATDVIDRQLRQLVRLIDDLLDVSRITSGKVRLKPERLDTSAVIARAVESVRDFVKDRGHQLTVSVSPEPMPLIADPARLEQVLANLLNNAAKYTDRGGKIDLQAGPEGSEVVVRVRDNGTGIAAEMLPRIFDLFAQADNSIERAQGGLGIGLTLVKTLVTMHGGHVSVASDGPGKGSEFTVRLPRHVAHPAPAQHSPPRPRPSNVQTCRILVVDDNADSLRGTSRLLGRLGHQVMTAQDGPAGLALALEHRPDVVVLDIGLPGMSGYEIAQAIRQAGPSQPTLIAVSGYAQEKDRQRSREAGFDHHLAKPVDVDALNALIADCPPGA